MAEPHARTFGRYRLLHRLASGGMGELFVALGPDDELCVVKRMLGQHLDAPEFKRMFLAEARLLQRLRHSHVVAVHEVGEVDGQPFFSMEYVRGRSLRDLIDAVRGLGKALPARHVVEIGQQLLLALDHAHRATDDAGREIGVVHRDINPHNVLIGWDGRVRLIDFGIAKSDISGFHTAVGTIKGKFAYMSPEQSAADPVDARSDLFSAGIVLYEALTLENPFARANVVLALEAIQLHPVPPPSSTRADVAALDDVLLRALDKNPDLRFQNAAEFSAALTASAPRLRESPGPLPALMRVVFANEIASEASRLAPYDDPPTDPGSRPARTPAEAPDTVVRPSSIAFSRSVPGGAASDPEPTPPLPRAATAPAAFPSVRPEPAASSRPRPGWLPYLALLGVVAAFSFAMTRVAMNPVPPEAAPLGTLRIDATPPVWLGVDAGPELRTPATLRLRRASGRLEVESDDGSAETFSFRIADDRLRIEGRETEATSRATTVPIGSQGQLRLEWQPPAP